MKKCCCLLFLFIASIGMASNAFGRETAPLSAEQVIQALKLVPMSDEACPGFYLPTYESKTRAAVDKDRAAASLIYYLMTPQISIDPWHIISSDEIMLYHAGAPMVMLLLYPDGKWKEVVLGPDITNGQVMQYVIPAGTWMGFVKQQDPTYDWGLYGVMVCPGWHIEDIRFIPPGAAENDALKRDYPGVVTRGTELGLF